MLESTATDDCDHDHANNRDWYWIYNVEHDNARKQHGLTSENRTVEDANSDSDVHDDDRN